MTKQTLINWFKPEDRYVIAGGGTVYTGPAPFYCDKKDWSQFYDMPWVVSYDGMRDKLWHVVGIETFAITTIPEGISIGLTFDPWEDR